MKMNTGIKNKKSECILQKVYKSYDKVNLTD